MKHNAALPEVVKKLVKPSSILALFIAIGASGCASNLGVDAAASYDKNPLEVVIPAGLSSEVIHNAMLETVVDREWVVKSHSEHEVTARLIHRQFVATVTLQSDGSIIKILNKSIHIDSATGKDQPAVPLSWLRYIQADLRLKLATAQYL